MTKATVRDHKVDPSGLFADFEYSWKDRYLGKKLYLSKDEVNPLKIKVPTDMGMLAICAKYKMAKGLDIRYIANINSLTEALELLYREVKDSDTDCKKSIIFSVARSDFRWDEGILMHVVPVVISKYLDPAAPNGHRMAVFFMDSIVNRQSDWVNGTHEVREFMYKKRFGESGMGEGADRSLLPLFMSSAKTTQVDGLSCRVKAIVDMRRVLSMSGEGDEFRKIVLAGSYKTGINSFDLPMRIHKTTQNSDMLSELRAKKGAEMVSKKPNRDTFSNFLDKTSGEYLKMSEEGIFGKISWPSYLFDKADKYLLEIAQLATDDPENLSQSMVSQSMDSVLRKKELLDCFSEHFAKGEDVDRLASAVVKGAIAKAVAHVSRRDHGAHDGHGR